MNVKDGIKTTEFALTILPIVLSIVDAIFGTKLYHPEMFAGAGAYAIGRSIMKRAP